MSSEEVRLMSIVAGFTAEGKLHTLSVWFILALQLMMGLAFLQSGVEKVLSDSFSDAGYLQNAPPANGSLVADLFVLMGETGWFVDFVNVAVRGARSSSASDSCSARSPGSRRSGARS